MSEAARSIFLEDQLRAAGQKRLTTVLTKTLVGIVLSAEIMTLVLFAIVEWWPAGASFLFSLVGHE